MRTADVYLRFKAQLENGGGRQDNSALIWFDELMK